MQKHVKTCKVWQNVYLVPFFFFKYSCELFVIQLAKSYFFSYSLLNNNKKTKQLLISGVENKRAF